MNRYFLNHTHCDYCYAAVMDTDYQGDYVLFADIEPIIADRDIKAANLQLLVDKVLDIDSARTDSAERFAMGLAIELARGLKQ